MSTEEKIKKIILNRIEAEFIYIFGSYALGLQNSQSDIDIAFYSKKAYSSYDIFILAQKLSSELGREIDLVQMKESSTVFQKEIISKGKIIFEKNRLEREKIENLILKKYIKLNEERKKIIDSYEV